MTALDATPDPGGNWKDAWTWWQARRLEYNLTLAAAGWIAYGLGIAVNYAFGHSMWQDWRGGLSTTLFLGTAYLLAMGVANACFLLGPLVESWARPKDIPRYRRATYAMGRWGSLLIPFSFPLILLAGLIANS